MTLPRFPRVLFRKPPLALTLAQVRFDPRFGVADTRRLAAFQESIEDVLPRVEQEMQMGLQISLRGIEAQPSAQELTRFRSADGRISALLGRDALTLEIRKFDRIEELEEHFRRAIDALIEHFRPPTHTRVGLRFINEFRHPKGNTLPGWKDLLKPELFGLAGESMFGDSVQDCMQQVRIADDGYSILIRHGFSPRGSTVPPPTNEDAQDGPFYLLDLDCFSEEPGPLESGAVIDRVKTFNEQLYGLFRWSLSDALFESFEPTDV